MQILSRWLYVRPASKFLPATHHCRHHCRSRYNLLRRTDDLDRLLAPSYGKDKFTLALNVIGGIGNAIYRSGEVAIG